MIDDMHRINYQGYCYRVTPYIVRRRFANCLKRLREKVTCENDSVERTEFMWARACFQSLDDSGLFRCGESRIIDKFLNYIFEKHIKYG